MTEQSANWTRRKLLRRGGATASGLAVGGAALPGTAAANRAIKFEEDLTGMELFNPCTEELLEVTDGVIQFVERSSVEGCRRQFSAHVVWRGVQAVGVDSGLTYQLNASENISSSLDICDRAPATTTVTSTYTITGQQSAKVWRVQVRLHYTVTPDGERSVEFERGSAECTGRP